MIHCNYASNKCFLFHFQDLETMSQELVRLSKYPVQQANSDLTANVSTAKLQDTPSVNAKCSSANGAVL